MIQHLENCLGTYNAHTKTSWAPICLSSYYTYSIMFCGFQMPTFLFLNQRNDSNKWSQHRIWLRSKEILHKMLSLPVSDQSWTGRSGDSVSVSSPAPPTCCSSGACSRPPPTTHAARHPWQRLLRPAKQQSHRQPIVESSPNNKDTSVKTKIWFS